MAGDPNDGLFSGPPPATQTGNDPNEGLFDELPPIGAPAPPTAQPPRSYTGASIRSTGQSLISQAAGGVAAALEGIPAPGFGGTGLPSKDELLKLYRNDPQGFDRQWNSWMYAPARLEEEFADRATATMGNLTEAGKRAAAASYNPFSDKPFVLAPTSNNAERLFGDYVQSAAQSLGLAATLFGAAKGGVRGGAIGGAAEGLLEGQQTRQQARQSLEAAPLAAYSDYEPYQKLISEGWHPEMAKKYIVETLSTIAGKNTAIASAMLAAGGGALLGHLTEAGGGVFRRIATGALEELPVETGQSAVGQIEQNLADKQLDPQKSMWEDVPEQAWQGAIMGPIQGGTFNAVLGRRRMAAVEKDAVTQTLGTTPDVAFSKPLPAMGSAIVEGAKAAGIPPEVAVGISSIETGGTFNPNLVNSIGATGLFQFLGDAAAQYGVTREQLLANPNLQIAAGMKMLRDAYTAVEKATGRPALPGEVYMAQLFGHGGVQKILTAPDSESLLSVVKGYGGSEAVLTQNNLPLDFTVGQAKERYAGLMAAHMRAGGLVSGTATNPSLGDFRSDALKTLLGDDTEMLGDSHLVVDQTAADAAARVAPVGTAANPDTMMRLREADPVIVDNQPVTGFTTARGSTYQLHEDGTTTRNKAARPEHPGDSGLKARSEQTVYVNPEFAREVGMWQTGSAKSKQIILSDGKVYLLSQVDEGKPLGRDPSINSSEFTTIPEIGRSPLELWKLQGSAYFGNHPGSPITSLNNVQQIDNPASLLDIGMTDDMLATRRSEPNPNNRIKREDRPVQFGPADTIGKPISEIGLKPGQVVTAGVPFSGATHEFMDAVHKTVQSLISRFAPSAKVILTYESRGEGLAWMRSRGDGVYHINPKEIYRFHENGPVRHNATDQIRTAYALAHEIGHVVITHEFDRLLSRTQQLAIETLPSLGYFSDEFIAGLPKDLQGIVREYNEKKRSLIDNPRAGAKDFIQQWLSPWKTSYTFDQANKPELAWERYANKIKISPRLSAKGFAISLEQQHPGILGLHEYLAEQFARYAQNRKLIEGTELASSNWFKMAIERMQAFFKAVRLAKMVAPGTTFAKWLSQLPDVTPQPNPRARRQAVPQWFYEGDARTRFDEPSDIALRDKLQFADLENDLGTEIIRKFPDGLELPRRLYHGTGANITQFSLKRATDGLYGRGIYLTDRPATASEYAEKSLNRADHRNASVMDMEDLRAYFTPGRVVPSYGGTDTVLAFHEGTDGRFSVDVKSTAPGWQPTRNHSTSPTYAQFDQVMGNEKAPNVLLARADIKNPYRMDGWIQGNQVLNLARAVEVLEPNHAGDAVALDLRFHPDTEKNAATIYSKLVKLTGDKEGANKILQAAGFDGITHLGGKVTGGAEHRVWIAFDPKQVSIGVAPTTPPARLVEARREALELLAHGQPETAKEVIERATGNMTITRWDGTLPGMDAADEIGRDLSKLPSARSSLSIFWSSGIRRAIELGHAMLDVRQMTAQNGHILGLRMINDAMTNKEAYQGTLETRSTQVMQEWAKLKKQQFNALSRMLENEYASGKHSAPLQLNNGKLEYTPNAEFVQEARKAGLDERGAQVFLDVKNDYLLRMNLLQKYMRSAIVRAREDNPGREAYYNAKMQALGQMFDSIRAVPFHPQTRYGNYFLEVRRPGESQPFHVQSFESAAARASAREAIERFGRSKSERWSVSETYLDSQAAVMRVLPPQVMDSIGLGGQLTPKQRRQLMSTLDIITRNGVLRKYSPELGNVTGASKEHIRVYSDFMHNDALLLSKLAFRQDFIDGLNEIKQVITEASRAGDSQSVAQLESVLKFASKAVRQILNPAQEWHALRSFIVMHDLWFNVKSAVANLTDLPKIWARVTKMLGDVQGNIVLGKAVGKVAADRLVATMQKVLRAPADGWAAAYTAEEQRALTRATAEGVIDETAAAQLSGWANAGTLERMGMPGGTRLVDTAMRVGMAPFKIIDQFTRRVTFLTMFNAYREQGLSEPIAYDRAKQETYLLQQDNSIINRAQMMRGRKSIFTVYYNYTRSTAWLLSGFYSGSRRAAEKRGDIPPARGFGNETFRMWAAYAMLGGLMGLPGAEDLDGLLELIAKQMRYRFSPKELAYELARDVADSANDLGLPITARSLIHGATSFIPLPGGGAVDISPSVGLGRVVPGLGGVDKLGGRAEDEFLTGLMGPLGRRVQEAMNLFKSDLPPERRYALAIPSSVNNLVTGINSFYDQPRFFSGGRIMVDPRTGEIKDLTTGEIVAQMMGFAPAEVAARRELHVMQKEYADYWMGRRNGLLAQAWEARLQKSADAIHDSMEAVRKFNADAPPSLRITGDTLTKSLQHRQQGARRDELGQAPTIGLRPGYRQIQDSVLGGSR